jgi:hypothetical protein
MKNQMRVAFFLAASLMASASTIYTATCVTNNTGNCNALAPQFELTAVNNGTSVAFNLLNEATGLESVIAAIYFDTPNTFTGITSFTGSTGVSFKLGGSPANPPAANGFNTDFYLTATPPPPHNGLGLGDSITINLGVAPLGNVDAALQDTQIALHVISFQDKSETLIFTPTDGINNHIDGQVPEPTTLGLVGSALIGVGLLRKRRKK